MLTDKFGREFKVNDYVARPTKYGGARVNEINQVLKLNPKSIKCVSVSKFEPTGPTIKGQLIGIEDIKNYGECIIINDIIKKEWGI